jgi:antitoxin (DNA-binding transcriptional repressor) of toxin-antitoxin stability system
MSHACYSERVPREITQRELRNESGEVMRALDAGESFIVTRNGVGVGELTPLRRRRFVDRVAVIEAFAGAAPIDSDRFRQDVDRLAVQDPTPRA